jgi:hypothetical protein
VPSATVRETEVDCEERKRLGQFFTGEHLARLLAALTDARSAGSVIDPMAGSGDMLMTLQECPDEQLVGGIEIDPDAAALCASRLTALPNLRIVEGNAFSHDTWRGLTNKSWDLVITNPPYVRYQRGAQQSKSRFPIPSAQEVREGLIQLLRSELTFPSDCVRQDFLMVAQNYSGLADLAVPSWILCAALVAPEGRLAMVVPDTWLSRNYALPVLYLLTRYFEIEAVVEDGEASWFDDALVRTTLFVARRLGESNDPPIRESYVHVRLSLDAADARSLVGAAFPDAVDPEDRFARLVNEVASGAVEVCAPGVQVEKVPLGYFSGVVESHAAAPGWLRSRSSSTGSSAQRPIQLPRRALSVLIDHPPRFRSVESYGWSIGQGLRTGANRFFYGSRLTELADATLVAVDPIYDAAPLEIPNDALWPVIRKQQDLAAGGRDGRLIALWNYVLPEGADECLSLGVACPYKEMPQSLADYVRLARRINFGTDAKPRFIPHLSAVITNERRADPERPDVSPRYWYQLPHLAPRHRGELFMARVNYETPVPLLNRASEVIDANFTTLWRTQEDAVDPLVMLTMLRSTWAQLMLETAGTVLGGGALKVEATHLRRLPLPRLTEQARSTLRTLGEAFLRGQGSAQDEIDEVIWRSLPEAEPKRARALLVDVRKARGRG